MQCLSPVTVKRPDGIQSFPCGKCLACLTNRRRDWVIRLKYELKRSSSALFLTLTYDEDHIPECGVNKDDVQRFLKRLRKGVPDHKLRYFLVSEYGSHTERAHYHMILFNYPIEKGYDEKISSHWQAGFVHIGSVTGASISYCAKYCLSIGKEPSNQNKVFMLCSRRPGIGSNYMSNNSLLQYHRHDCNDVTVVDGVKTVIPRYYRDKIYNRFQKDKIKLRNYEKMVENSLDYYHEYCEYDSGQLERGAATYETQLKEDFIRKTERIINKNHKI